jgi:hypothetical protein
MEFVAKTAVCRMIRKVIAGVENAASRRGIELIRGLGIRESRAPKDRERFAQDDHQTVGDKRQKPPTANVNSSRSKNNRR